MSEEKPNLVFNENHNRKRVTRTLGDKATFTLKNGQKTKFSITLKPNKDENRIQADIKRFDKNEDKITYGIIENGGNRIEFCSYKRILLPNPNTLENNAQIKKLSPIDFLIFLNGEYIKLEKEDLRKLFKINFIIGNKLGLLGRKKHIKKR